MHDSVSATRLVVHSEPRPFRVRFPRIYPPLHEAAPTEPRTSHRAAAVAFNGAINKITGGNAIMTVTDPTNADPRIPAPAADGTRASLETPEPLQGIRPGLEPAERRIRKFAASPAGARLHPEKGRIEWTIHYSINSDRLDRVRVLETDSPGEAE